MTETKHGDENGWSGSEQPHRPTRITSPVMIFPPAAAATVTTSAIANGSTGMRAQDMTTTAMAAANAATAKSAASSPSIPASSVRTAGQPPAMGAKTSLPTNWGAASVSSPRNRLHDQSSNEASVNSMDGSLKPRTMNAMLDSATRRPQQAGMSAAGMTTNGSLKQSGSGMVSSASLASRAGLINPPSLVTYGPLRLLIADAPSDHTLPLYLKEFERYGVTDVVRVCKPTYKRARLEQLGYAVHDWPFDDGNAPPAEMIHDWLTLLDERFGSSTARGHVRNKSSTSSQSDDSQQSCVAIHCIAGLGRAPVLVAIALIEYGMSPLDSVLYVRERRRGAINNTQLRYVKRYQRRSHRSCVIS